MVSPHVYDVRERVQINGQLISKKQFVSNLSYILRILAEQRPSYFEVLTCLGFYTAAQNDLDYQVVEVGFGGRWDTTNTISRPDKLSVIGQIGLDHTAILGPTVEAITHQKAGIIKAGNQVVALRQTPEVNQIIEAAATNVGAPLHWVETQPDYQQSNDAMAITIVKALADRDNWQFNDETAQKALQRIFIPGRYEKRSIQDRLIILDGAHNPQKLAALASRLQREQTAPCTIILAIGERKDWLSCLKQLQPVAARIIASEFFSQDSDLPHRAVPAGELAAAAKQLGIPAEIASHPATALHQALHYPNPIVATGSFYLLSEVDNAFNQ